MFVQIDGIYYPNKGDQLMLHAINEKLKQAGVTAVFGKGKTYADPYDIRTSGIFQLAVLQRFKLRFDKVISGKYLFSLGLVKEEKISAVLDAGGFQYGDQWEDFYSGKYVARLERYLKRRKKSGQRLVFMPQAFGPFEKKLSRKVIRTVYRYADVIYARDSKSYDFLVQTLGNDAKIRIAPDFTVLLGPAELKEDLRQLAENAVIIIPNSKMITHTPRTVSEKYTDFLAQISKFLIQKGEKLLFVNHEGPDDLNLIRSVKKLADIDVPVIDLPARQTKAVIGQAKLVITSRYHGLMSSLSQNIPSFATSWSHKYVEILRFYGLEDYLLKPENIDGSIDKIKTFLENPASYPMQKHKQAAQKHKQLARQMWDEIFKLLGL